MASSEEIKNNIESIEELEKKKGELIEEAKKINRRLRYKTYELKALEPYLNSKDEINAYPLRRKLRGIEFKISTAAFTPRMEKEMVKEVKTIETKLKKANEIERARRKKGYVEKDISEANNDKEKVDNELDEIRKQLKIMRDSLKQLKTTRRMLTKNSSNKKSDEPIDSYVSLEDIVEFERKG